MEIVFMAGLPGMLSSRMIGKAAPHDHGGTTAVKLIRLVQTGRTVVKDGILGGWGALRT